MENLTRLLNFLDINQNNSSRTYRYNVWLIAREYFKLKDYKNSLIFASNALLFYKNQGWIDLLNPIINLSIRSAYYSGDLGEFVKLGLEFLGKWNESLSLNQKVLIQENIFRILKNEFPSKIDFLGNYEQQELAMYFFQSNLSNNEEVQNIDLFMMNHINGFVDAKVCFSNSQIYADELLNLKIYLILNTPNQIIFDGFNLIFTNDYYNQFCKETKKIVLDPEKLYTFEYVFKLHPKDINSYIQVSELILFLTGVKMVINCRWSFTTNKYLSHFSGYNDLNKHLKFSDDFKNFCSLSNNTLVKIDFRKPLLEININYNQPTLYDENFVFDIVLINNELDEIQNVDLYIRQYKDDNEDLLNEFTCPNSDVQIFEKSKLLKISLSKVMEKNSSLKKILYMHSKTIGNFLLEFNFSYNIRDVYNLQELNCTENYFYHTCSVKKIININTVFPFENIFIIENVLKSIDNFCPRALEPFYLQIKMIANSKIQIKNVNFLLNTNQFVLDDFDGNLDKLNNQCKLVEKIFEPGEEFSEFLRLYSKNESDMKLALGVLVIKWERLDNFCSLEHKLNETRILLPSFSVQPSLLYIETNFPLVGYVKQRINISYKIYNRTDNVLPLSFFIDNNLNFIYSGNKQKKIIIDPKQYWIEDICFFPLFCGFLALPKIKIVAYPNTRSALSMDDLLEEILPSFLKIIPKY